MGPYLAYNGTTPAQSTGALVLVADELSADDWVTIISNSPQLTITTLVSLAQFLVAASTAVGLVATGNSQATALPLPAARSVFSSVPPGTAAIIPQGVQGVWDVWVAAGTNNLSIYPPEGSQIEGFGVDQPATVVAGGRSTFTVVSLTEVYAR